jgi:hypothetical protein
MAKLELSDLPKVILTNGKLFPDGGGIERLQGNLLLQWRNGEEVIAPMGSYNDQPYAPAILDPSLEEILCLPTASQDFGSVEELVAELRQVIDEFLGLDQPVTFLVAGVILSTWVPECLPALPVLNPWGAAGAGTTLLELLSCLCRQPMNLAGTSLRELAQLPQGLSPTVILRSAGQRTLAPLLGATSDPNAAILQKGRLIKMRIATIAYTKEPLGLPALSLPVCASGEGRRFNLAQRQELLDHFQPLLLRYRLQQHRKIADSQFDCPAFSSETRRLAQMLGAAVEGAPDVQAAIVAALAGVEEQHKVEYSQSWAAMVLEALLCASHQGSSEIYVKEVAQLTNGILRGRYEDTELSPKKTGEIIRQDLGLFTKRSGSGYKLVLDSKARQLIHRLAVAFGALSTLNPFPDCRFCDDLSGQNVHDVHEVHEVQEVHDNQLQMMDGGQDGNVHRAEAEGGAQ